ncbi:MAG: hypothetical protein AMXMBFR64_41090 [Myxococcales bacterium]
MGPASPREPSIPDAASLAQAASSVLRHPGLLEEPEREALIAWLSAWASHWPSSFAVHFGRPLQEVVLPVVRPGDDPNRFLKLRRLALAHLAELL